MNEQMKKGRAAYAQMEAACNLLVQSGNWQRVGKSDIRLFLDMYTQALLLRFAQHTGYVSENMKRFVAEIPARDVLAIGKATCENALNIGHKNRSFAVSFIITNRRKKCKRGNRKACFLGDLLPGQRQATVHQTGT